MAAILPASSLTVSEVRLTIWLAMLPCARMRAHGLAEDASFVQFDPTGAVQRMEGTASSLNLGTEHAGHGQVLRR